MALSAHAARADESVTVHMPSLRSLTGAPNNKPNLDTARPSFIASTTAIVARSLSLFLVFESVTSQT